MAKSARLSAELRRAQLVEAAAKLVLAQGHLPIPINRLAAEAGVSKALIYSHFPEQQNLMNAVLAAQFAGLEAAGLEAASKAPDLQSAAIATANIYFQHVAERGPLCHVILRDHFMARRVQPDLAAFRDRIVRRLARRVMQALKLPAKEAVGAINLVITVPEDLGRMVWQGDISMELGADLVGRLTLSSIDALKPTEAAS